MASSEQYPESSGAQQAWEPPRQTANQALLDAMTPEMPDIPVGGRLKHFVNRWKNITSDSSILDIVTGMHIELTDLPVQSSPPPILLTFLRKRLKQAMLIFRLY